MKDNMFLIASARAACIQNALRSLHVRYVRVFIPLLFSSSPDQSGTNVSVPSVTQSQTVNNEVQTQAPSVTPITSCCIRSEQTGLGTMPIIHVKVKLECSDSEIVTHAFQDSGSSNTLITEHLMKQFGTNGIRTTINLTT